MSQQEGLPFGRENEVGLPAGWLWTTVGAVAETIRGVTYQKSESASEPAPGLVGVLRATNISGVLDFEDLVWVPAACVSDDQRLRAGDILVATSSGSLAVVGKAARCNVDTDHAFGAFCMVVRPRGAISRYLSWYFQTPGYRRTVSEAARGVNINNLKKGDLLHLEVPVPPEREQVRICDTIEAHVSRLDAAVATLERVRANLQRARASVLKAAVEGRLVPTEAALARAEGRDYETGEALLQRILEARRARWEEAQAGGGRRRKYEEPVGPETEGLGELPEGWVWATVEQLSVLVTDGDHNPPKRVPEGVPHLTAKNVKGGRLTLAGCSYVSEEGFAQTSSRYLPTPGDVIVTCVGTVGQVAVVPAGLRFSADRNLAAIRPVVADSTPFLATALSSPSMQRTMSSSSGATAQPHLYLRDLRRLTVPVPPLVEQARIQLEADVQTTVLDALAESTTASVRRCARLRQSILKRAFEGRLVPQDPTDEPAEKLLARLGGGA
ncbi:MAG: restriction endonuclease subunit S [Alphaproteobacteria bacterium]|nr:restriction endonuclease subunit S [Alphaproteobacteria bacterium]